MMMIIIVIFYLFIYLLCLEQSRHDNTATHEYKQKSKYEHN